MLSGRKALKNIDNTLGSVRNDAVRLDQQLSRLSGQVAMSQRQRLSLIHDIAKVRLNEIESGELDSELNAADANVVEILAQRETAIDRLTADIDSLNKEIEDGDAERERLLGQCNDVSDQLVGIESKVQAELKLSQAYI